MAETSVNPDLLTLPVELGALTQVPVYEGHKRGRNWLARVQEDPRSPGGLRRQFLPRGRGRFYYVIDDLEPGDSVEFGADYLTGSGRREKSRRYYEVVELREDALVLRPQPGH